MSRAVKNTAASVRQRLQNLSRQRGEQFQTTMVQYGLERLMYRLSRSSWRSAFLLKGALLFVTWLKTPWRTTRDLDLLGLGGDTIPEIKQVFRGVCDVRVVDDGLEFHGDTVRAEEIREATEYHGVRVTLMAMLGTARIPLQVDIGFGDAVTPKAERVVYPTLLDLPAPVLKAYPLTSVVSEKFETLVRFGMLNSRMKDFHDLWIIARSFRVEGAVLRDAIAATFKRRKTSVPHMAPAAFSTEFARDKVKTAQWQAFLRKNRLDGPPLVQAIALIKRFLMPVKEAISHSDSFDMMWPAGGPWKRASSHKETNRRVKSGNSPAELAPTLGKTTRIS